MKQFLTKLFLVIAVALIAIACSMDEDKKIDFVVEFIPVEGVDTPQYVVPGNTYPVTMYFKRPNDCYYVQQEPYYSISGSVRTVAVQALVIEDANCMPLDTTVTEEKTFNFQCPLTTDNSFTFRFYKGNDAAGNQQFIDVTIPVQH